MSKQGSAFEKWMADDRAAAGLVIPKGYSDAVAGGKQASLTIVSTQGSSGASTAAAEVRSLAGEQVTVELASRAAGQAIWATRSYPAGALDGLVADPPRRPAPSSPRRSPTRP